MPTCNKCKKEYELYSLFCARAGRGANSICKNHNHTDLYCTDCLIEIGVMDSAGHFKPELEWRIMIDIINAAVV